MCRMSKIHLSAQYRNLHWIKGVNDIHDLSEALKKGAHRGLIKWAFGPTKSHRQSALYDLRLMAFLTKVKRSRGDIPDHGPGHSHRGHRLLLAKKSESLHFALEWEYRSSCVSLHRLLANRTTVVSASAACLTHPYKKKRHTNDKKQIPRFEIKFVKSLISPNSPNMSRISRSVTWKLALRIKSRRQGRSRELASSRSDTHTTKRQF